MNAIRRVDGLTGGQVAAVALLAAAVLTDPSVLQIPDVVYEVAFPATFAALFGVGIFAALRSRPAPLSRIVSTITCGALFVLLMLLTQVPKSLPGL